LEFNVPFQHKYGYIRDETAYSTREREFTFANKIERSKPGDILKFSTPQAD